MDKLREKTEGVDDLKALIEQQQAIIEEKRAEIFRLKSVIEKLPGSIYWKDKHGVYLGCNEFVLKMAGVRHDKEIIGKTDFNMPWKKYAEELHAIDQQVLETELPIETEESPVLANGQQAIMLTHKAPLRDENGDVIGIIGVSVDITERKQMEALLEEAKNKAELANQTKTAFLENMRHDIRTPLTGIIGCADILKETSTNPEVNEYLDGLVTSSHALLNLLNEVLEASKVNSGEIPLLKRKFDLKARLEEVINLNKARAGEKGIALLFEYDENIAHYVIGDPTRIHRIMLELIANALNYTEKGYVKLSVKLAKRTDRELIVKLLVEDTGIGIPADKQQEVFVQFRRLTPSYEGIYKGAGLGLAVVKQFIDSIQGEIYVESELQKGTKFTCIIPFREALLDDEFGSEKSRNHSIESLKLNHVKPRKSAKIVKAEKTNLIHTSSLSMQPSKILLVEDHPVAGKISKNILLELGCEVDIAENGRAALDLVEKTPYDLIFMDIGLPDMDGYQVTQQIRSHGIQEIAQIPIVALTAHVEREEKQHGLAVGMNTVITKPLTKKWAESILETFIPERKSHLKQIQQVDQKIKMTQIQKVVDFEYAKVLVGGNEAVVYEMLAMLVESFPIEIEEMQLAYEKKDWKALYAIAHKLKGGSSYCGTLLLKSACSELESYIKAGLTEKIPELYQKMVAEMWAVQKFVSDQSVK